MNCESKIKIFTDAKSLIYAKRNSTHSILLNGTLNYLANFISMGNVEIYHVPGDVNVLADVMSRAIADNINCTLPREHPISKKWAEKIPPINDKFNVDRETLFKFLTTPLKPEDQDPYSRTHKKLMEPKSVQTWYDLTKDTSSEERFNHAISLLEQWNREYVDKEEVIPNYMLEVNKAALTLELTKAEECAKEIERILDVVYSEIKNTPVIKQINAALVEASKKLINIRHEKISKQNVKKYTQIIEEVQGLIKYIDNGAIIEGIRKKKREVGKKIAESTVKEEPDMKVSSNMITCRYKSSNHNNIEPEWNPKRDSLEIPIRESMIIKPNEIKIVDLGFEIRTTPDLEKRIGLAEGWDKNIKLIINTNLVRNKYEEGEKISIQNISEDDIKIGANTKLIEAKIVAKKKYDDVEDWEELKERETDKKEEEESEKAPEIRYCHIDVDEEAETINKGLFRLDPESIFIGDIEIKFMGDPCLKHLELVELQDFDNRQLRKSTQIEERKMPEIPVWSVNTKEEDRKSKEKEMEALLTADLLENKRLSTETFIELQNDDPKIRKIKENLLGNPKAFDTFIIRNGILCKKFGSKKDGMMFMGPYVPDKILRAVVVYIHRRNLHPSTSQTAKEFKAYYYHPMADKTVKEICRNCITCTQTRNKEKRNIGVGRQRSLKPTKPREGVSMDIIYLPKSKDGNTHGLLIGDLFSLYISFYPMKSKTSSEVAKKLNLYISSHGVPKSIYSDSDPSFRGETEKVIRMYGIQHATSFPYTQKENAVEAQVRTFKTASRAAIAESEVFKRDSWDKLFPIVICRINSLISKYGMSREAMHFGNMIESSLPLITDTELFSPLEEDMEETAKKFRDKMGRFMAKRERNKKYYKIGKEHKFYIYELVMKAEYVTGSALHPTHNGPHRIIGLSEKGAEIKDIKTGEISNVSFENLRKITLDELLVLLPQNYDDEISKALSTFRYNRKNVGTQ